MPLSLPHPGQLSRRHSGRISFQDSHPIADAAAAGPVPMEADGVGVLCGAVARTADVLGTGHCNRQDSGGGGEDGGDAAPDEPAATDNTEGEAIVQVGDAETASVDGVVMEVQTADV